MAKLPEETKWEAGIYQIEQTDPVVGGPPDLAKGQGITNVPARQLANRTVWLKGQIKALQQALANIDVSADIQAAIDALIDGAPDALNTLKELAAAIGNDPNFAATIARQMGTKLTKDAGASVARLVSAGGLYVNGGHVGDGDNDYGLIINAFEPAISLLDRSDKAGSVQIRAQSDGSIWLLRDTRNDGTIGHDSSKTTKIVVKLSPDGPIFYNANGDRIAQCRADGQIWTKKYDALENHFAARNMPAYAVGSYTIAVLIPDRDKLYARGALVSGAEFLDADIFSDIGSDYLGVNIAVGGDHQTTLPGAWRVMSHLAHSTKNGLRGINSIILIQRVA